MTLSHNLIPIFVSQCLQILLPFGIIIFYNYKAYDCKIYQPKPPKPKETKLKTSRPTTSISYE